MEKKTRLLLVQIRNTTVLDSFEIVNKDFRKYRDDLLIKYPSMKKYLKKEFFDFDKIWPNWINILSWSDVENNMSLKFISANIDTPTTVLDGVATPEKIICELNKAKNIGFPYTHVGFGIYPVGYLQFIECAKSVKQFDPNIITIGGSIGSLIDETKHYVDYVFKGDGVKTLRQFFGEDVNKPYKVNLSLTEYEVLGINMGYLVTKLGCPRGCDFCPSSLLFGKQCTPPLVTPQEVYKAIINVKESSTKNLAISVCEPNMLLYRSWWYELFELFEGYKTPISIGGPATMQSLKKFDFERITNSSLHFSTFNIGIESFSEHYSKNLEFNEMKKIIDKLRNMGISTLATFIVGFENQTRESILEEIKLLAKLDCHHNIVQNLKAFPGTEKYYELKEADKLVTNIPIDFYYISGFQSFEHSNFKIGFEDMLPLLYEIYKYLFRASGPEILNLIEIYENKPLQFPYFENRVTEFKKFSKALFRSWKKHLNPTNEQIERYQRKMLQIS